MNKDIMDNKNVSIFQEKLKNIIRIICTKQIEAKNEKNKF